MTDKELVIHNLGFLPKHSIYIEIIVWNLTVAIAGLLPVHEKAFVTKDLNWLTKISGLQNTYT